MPRTRSNPHRVIAALVLVQIFFGLHYPAAKLLLIEIAPRGWALIRVSVAAVVLLLAVRPLGGRLPTDWPTLWRLALYAIFGVGLNQVLFVEGLSRTTVIHSSLMVTTIPVGTLLFAALAGRERFTPRKALVLAVGSAGVLLVIRPDLSSLLATSVVGDGLTLLNALSFSLFLVLSKPLLDRTEPIGATAALFGFGTLWIVAAGIPDLLALDPSRVSPRAWMLGIYIILFPTAVAYLLQYWALARVESSKVAFFIYLQPLIAASFSMIFLGEQPGSSVLLGGLLIFAAVYLALRRGQV